MPDTRDPQSVISAAEQAATAGDYASAERLLREAAELQEASLGPFHPELANTLNNLGVVYEVTGKPDEAERCFRRASEIATAVLPADHSFVATSRQNLDDFLTSRARAAVPLVLPTPAPPAAAVQTRVEPVESVEPAPRLSTPERTKPVAAPTSSRSREEAPLAVEATTWPRTLVIGALLAGGLLVVFLARPWFRGDDAPGSSPGTPAATPAASPAPVAEPKPIAPEPAIEPRTGAANEVSPKTTTPGRAGPAVSDRSKAAPVQKTSLVVAGAQLCRDLVTSGDWRCDPPTNPVARGRLLFYTRIKSPTATTVQHRWYQGDRLRKSVILEISANPGSGYRTYSRNTVESSGEWRVELRTRDGALLHEERFSVK
jgi:Tetratricopeptide repeat/Protein of unknown function (DUF2914)